MFDYGPYLLINWSFSHNVTYSRFSPFQRVSLIVLPGIVGKEVVFSYTVDSDQRLE